MSRRQSSRGWRFVAVCVVRLLVSWVHIRLWAWLYFYFVVCL